MSLKRNKDIDHLPLTVNALHAVRGEAIKIFHGRNRAPETEMFYNAINQMLGGAQLTPDELLMQLPKTVAGIGQHLEGVDIGGIMGNLVGKEPEIIARIQQAAREQMAADFGIRDQLESRGR